VPRHDSTDETTAALRRALLHVFDNHSDVPIADALWAALGTVVDPDDAIESRALEVIKVGLDALLSKRSGARSAVSEWHAFRHRCTGADSDALAILEIAEAVQRAAWLYSQRSPPFLDSGPAAVERLCGFLARRFGQTVPGTRDVEPWIAAHSPKGVRGKLTTAGIVARIVHRGRLLGARGNDEGRTLRRVTMVLNRHRFLE
jgi:hypothetical protein